MLDHRHILLLAAALAAAAPAPAADGFSAAVTGGTLGIGPEIGWRGGTIGVRADAAFLSFGHGFHADDIDYAGHARLRSAGATLDLYPFGGGFHVSGGVRYDGNRARAVATPTRATSIGGQSFTPAQIGTLSGSGTVHDIAPALTIGYRGGGTGRGLLYGIEGGALFQGRVRISRFVSSTGLIPQTRLEAERANLQDNIDRYRVYPILRLALGYRF